MAWLRAIPSQFLKTGPEVAENGKLIGEGRGLGGKNVPDLMEITVGDTESEKVGESPIPFFQSAKVVVHHFPIRPNGKNITVERS